MQMNARLIRTCLLVEETQMDPVTSAPLRSILLLIIALFLLFRHHTSYPNIPLPPPPTLRRCQHCSLIRRPCKSRVMFKHCCPTPLSSSLLLLPPSSFVTIPQTSQHPSSSSPIPRHPSQITHRYRTPDSPSYSFAKWEGGRQQANNYLHLFENGGGRAEGSKQGSCRGMCH